MKQKTYNKEMIEKKIKAISKLINEIVDRGGVTYDTALYAYLNTARGAIVNAVVHVGEFNDEFEKIHVQYNQ